MRCFGNIKTMDASFVERLRTLANYAFQRTEADFRRCSQLVIPVCKLNENRVGGCQVTKFPLEVLHQQQMKQFVLEH